jgi:type I restriction enzyme S subunit
LQGGSGFPVRHQGCYTESIPFIKVNSLASHISTSRRYDTVSRETAELLGAKVFSRGDIVFAKVGAALLLHRFEVLPFDCCIDNNMMAMYHISENNQWLKYTLSLLNFNALVNPGAVPSISQTQVAGMSIPCPPKNEQEQIVRYLDSMTAKINKLIRAKKKQIALLQEQRQAIINHAVTKGLDPNVEMKDSGIDWIGEIPKHWDINKISWLFGFIGSGTTPPNDNQHLFYENGTIPWINSGDLYQNDKYIQKIAKKVTMNALMSCSALKQYPKGTIVIAMYGASIGNMGITMESACCNQACCCLSMPKPSLSTDFAYYLLSSCKKHWVEQSYGGGQQNISQEIIKSTRIPIPPKEEQIQIVSFLDCNLRKLNNLISHCEHTIILLQEYKNSLISSVVTGQTDVRNIPVEDVIPDDLIPEDDPSSEIEDESTEESEE